MQWKGTAQAVDLGELPAQRSLEFRPKQKTEGVDAQTRTGYMEAAKAQIVGHPPASPRIPLLPLCQWQWAIH